MQQIVIASERAADLTKQMLAFSGKGSFVVEPMDLNTLVQENFMLLRASLSRSINIELRLGDEPCIIEADRGQMQQIVMNVLINASEAIGDNLGKIEIRTALIERTGSESSVLLRGVVPPGRYAFFEVRDNGSGMVPETVKRIFDPFFTTKFTGRGLGLAAVLGIVRGHGGDIEVETQLGVGATFRVLLPASERTVSVSKEPEPRCVARGTGQTILVVDDEEIVRNIAITALKDTGFSVLVATNGAEALAILTANSEVALVILDLTMPVMTGEKAIPLIKLSRPNVPIILSSGYSEAELSRRFNSAGISAFLQKPYTASAILAKVTQILEVLTP